MGQPAQPYSIQERTSPDGGLTLELSIEGERRAVATASGDVVEQMLTQFGLTRKQVVYNLKSELLEVLKHKQVETVNIYDPIEDPEHDLRFSSRYALHSRNENQIQAGIVWYDVPSSTTGPDDLPAIVRNSMRLEVHRKLTGPDTNAHRLVELLR